MNEIIKGFSTRQDGSMYLSATDWRPENAANRKRYFDTLGLGDRKIVAANLVHGTRVGIVTSSSENFLLGTDALVTREEGVVLTLTGADCFPVYFEEGTAGIVALAHSGWRGIVANIVPETIAAICALGGNAEDVSVTIGPGICAHHFEIGENVLPLFSPYEQFVLRKGEVRVDLKGIVKRQIAEAGVPLAGVSDWDECTYCLPEKYFSYRRDQPAYIEAQVAYIVRPVQEHIPNAAA
jgi:YfiH family protein